MLYCARVHFVLFYLMVQASKRRLAVRGHARLCSRADGVFALPESRDRLGLGVELDAGLAVKGVCTAARDALLVAGEGEHGEGYLGHKISHCK